MYRDCTRRAVIPHLQVCFLRHLLEMLKESATQTMATMILQSKCASTKCYNDCCAKAMLIPRSKESNEFRRLMYDSSSVSNRLL